MSEYSPPLLYKTTFVPLGKDSTLALDPDDCPIILKKPGLTFVKDNAENRILNSLTRKGQIMKEVTEKQAEEGIIFPCDFETYYEPDEVI